MALSAAGMLTLSATCANAQRAERELLGIRLWNKYSTVLQKYGQPTASRTASS